jgi:hypothetical protein
MMAINGQPRLSNALQLQQRDDTGSDDAADPQIAKALELAGRDPELGRWFDQHSSFQKSMRAKFQQIEVPAHLKASLLIRGLRSRRSSLARSGGAARSG